MVLKWVIKCLIRIRFFLTSKASASESILNSLEEYKSLGDQVSSQAGRQPFRVPEMRGVDEDMRDWSFYMILEHNVIVNRFMQITVENLAKNQIPKLLSRIDTKRDVMPSSDPGSDQLAAFTKSIEKYLSAVDGLGGLRHTIRFRHPVFGMLNAHGWHCMMALHLDIHLPQAKYVVQSVSSGHESN